MVGAEPRGATPASRESSCEGTFKYKVTGSYLTYSKAFILHGDGIFTFLDVSKVVDQRLQLVIVAFLIWKISNRIKKNTVKLTSISKKKLVTAGGKVQINNIL